MSHADLVLRGGRVFTGSRAGFFQALAISKGRVQVVGHEHEIAELIGPATRVVELEGRLAVPGFTDAHQHLTMLGLNLMQLNLRNDAGVSSVDQILGMVAQRAAELPPGAWIGGFGWNQSTLREGRPPAREELDRVAPRHPVYLSRTCGHVAVANSLALVAGGITVETPDPQGGHIERRDGRLTGLLSETAREPILDAKPKAHRADLINAIQAAGQVMLSQGYTGGSDMVVGHSAGWDEVLAYEELAAQDKLPLRVWLALDGLPQGPCIAQQAYDTDLRAGRQAGLLRYGGVKLFVDGSAGAGTAAMNEAYVGQSGNRGLFIYSDEELLEGLRRFHDQGWQLTTHAIGDAGIEQLLNALERIAADTPIHERRHRIEHCSFATGAQIERMARLGVLPGPQPVFMYEFGDTYVQIMGEERAAKGCPMREFWNAGLRPFASSDAPVCSTNPFHGLYAMTARRSAKGVLLGSSQCLRLDEALQAFSGNGAYAAFAENDRGQLTPGQQADVAVLSRDIFHATPEELRDQTRCDLTILNGRVVYQREDASV